MRCLTVILLAVSFLTEKAQAYSEPFRSNLLIGGGGSWMVFSKSGKVSFFNKFSSTLYSSGGGIKRVISVPMAWTVSVSKEQTRQRFFPGDFDMYFGHRFGWFEPRIGVVVPLGYGLDKDWKKKAWIGSDNMKIQTGFSISKTGFEHIGLPFGLETMVSIAVTEDNAYYKKGSLGAAMYMKSSYTLNKKTNVGGELALYGKIATWVWNGSTEYGLTILPTVFGSYRLTRKWYVGSKVGFGPSLGFDHGPFRRSWSCDAGMSVQYYP
jgi:hypothetical protein